MRKHTGIILIVLIFITNIMTIAFLLIQNNYWKEIAYNTNDIARQLEIDLHY